MKTIQILTASVFLACALYGAAAGMTALQL